MDKNLRRIVWKFTDCFLIRVKEYSAMHKDWSGILNTSIHAYRTSFSRRMHLMLLAFSGGR